MLRRTAHIILSVLLVFSTAGLAVTGHYCGPELVSVSFFDEPEPCCGTSGSCCHDDSRFIQVEDDFTTSSRSRHLLSPISINLYANCNVFHRDIHAFAANDPAAPYNQHPPPGLRLSPERLQSFLL